MRGVAVRGVAVVDVARTDRAAMGAGGTLDCRTLDKLYDGVNNTVDDSHMWLAPIERGRCAHCRRVAGMTRMTCGGERRPNIIFVYFDEPVTLSLIKVCAACCCAAASRAFVWVGVCGSCCPPNICSLQFCNSLIL